VFIQSGTEKMRNPALKAQLLRGRTRQDTLVTEQSYSSQHSSSKNMSRACQQKFVCSHNVVEPRKKLSFEQEHTTLQQQADHEMNDLIVELYVTALSHNESSDFSCLRECMTVGLGYGSE
jgi:hypothetical protein